ncbi:hypothetical protein [Spirillospora sp. NPDC047279]|uniref:hypothetical protein n=1 Tax=Spirillospora sp. NPDC047279 TaxID=3155478 RepID=UPI0033E6902F
MRFISKLAVVGLSALAVMPLGATAGASSATGTAAPSEASAARLESYIYNGSSLAMGVMRTWNGTGRIYGSGLYDKALPARKRTDTSFSWTRAQGFYLGSGYCGDIFYWNGSMWAYGASRKSGQHRLGTVVGQSVARWEVRQYRC